MRIRRSISLLGVTATALAGVAFASGTASASSGGGCGTANDYVVACVSASGGNVNYDAYVTATPPGCWDITLSIYNSNGGADTLHIGCGTGHHGPFSVTGLNGVHYHSSAVVNREYFAYSNYLYFSN